MPPQPSHDHLLVLDDDEVMRDLLSTLLSQEGYPVTLASSGQEALDQLHTGLTPAVVLTDLQMPGISGASLIAALRAAVPPSTLVIGMSGSDADPGTRAALDGFLRKPFDPQALAAAILTARTRHTAEADPAPGPASISNAAAPLDEVIFTSLAKKIAAPQLEQLYSMTLGDIEKRHARMAAAAAAGDQPTLRREAHTIKGSCGFVGAAELQALAASLETGTTPGTWALDEIPRACLRLRSMLKSKLHNA